MDIDSYTEFTDRVWQPPKHTEFVRDELELAICALGVTGEAGEVADLLKKYFHYGIFDEDKLVKELGDVYYYLARICKHFDIKVSHVLAANQNKLSDRKYRGVLHGEGSDR